MIYVEFVSGVVYLCGMQSPKDALEIMLDRMVQAGWIPAYARSKNQLLLKWTAEGAQAAKNFRVLFDKLGDNISADELAALLVVLDFYSPGSTGEPPLD